MADTTFLSNLSYVNKDFQSIYVELLDLVHKLTHRWDPSISNESDPGVMLIKLMAICTDKTNYISDKNVLECFPESVTQEPNARQLFEQLGYTMRWYVSATTDIAMRWVGEESIYTYSIPRFTMVSDDKNSVVYTIVDAPVIQGDGSTTTARAIQGVAENYAINGEELITTANLDSNNRLYFPDRNVAVNGIFICNADSTNSNGRQDNYSAWKRVTNLAVEPLGQYCYKFGVSNDGNSCYIEFPDDVQSLIDEGIYITYLVTDGENGNVTAKVINKLYSDVAITDPADSENEIVLNASNVEVINPSSTTNGYDPESISSAYRNYKKTVGTFNTLVTLRDYANAIVESGYVSNGFVCDRTNDIQTSYSIVSKSNDVMRYVTCVDEVEGVSLMDAFDLKLFLLKYLERPLTVEDYNKTFDVLVNSESATDPAIDSVLGYINDLKSVQHDFEPILPNRLVMFRNKYNVNCKIIPQYRVTSIQEDEIRKKVITTLVDKLNSKQIDFGEEVTFAEVYDIILNADERIKAITLDMLDYKTYAIYFADDGTYKEIPVGNIKVDHAGYFYNDAFYTTAEHSTLIASVVGDNYYDYSSGKIYTYNSNSQYNESIDSTFALEIYAKSVLHGNTPWATHMDNFAYNINQEAINEVADVSSVSTDTSVVIDAPSSGTGVPASGTTEVRANEVVQFYAPSLLDEMNYSNGVRFQFKLNGDTILPANADYALQAGESLVVYWKEDDTAVDYFYRKYGVGTVVKPSFPISRPTPVSPQVYTGDPAVTSGMPQDNGQGTTQGMMITYSPSSDEIPLTTYIEQNMNGSAFTTNSSKTITIRKKNIVTIDGKQFKCYWKLNSKNDDGMYELFPSKSSDFNVPQVYMLQTGEYFFYTPMDESALAYFGEGTKLTRTCTSNTPAMVCEAVDISEFITGGVRTFEDYWVTLGSTYTLTGEEMQFYAFGEGTELTIRHSSSSSAFKLTIANDGITWGPSTSDTNLSNYVISYKLKDSAKEEVLPPVVLSSEGWEARAILNFVPTPSTPQKLLSDQSITYYTKDGSSADISGGDGDNSVYVMADYAYAMSGGHNLDVTRMNSEGAVIYGQLYWYKDTAQSSLPSNCVEYLSNGNTRITLDGTNDVHIFFTVPSLGGSSRYLLPMYNPNSDIDVLTVEINGENVVDMYGSTDFKANNTYYLDLDSEYGGSSDFEMVIHAEFSGSSDKVVTLRPLFAYKVPEDLNADEFASLKSKILQLDTKRVFDFAYDVDEDTLVENPLDPNSFLDPNHIFNKFTICQMDTPRLTVFITNKIK